MRIKTHNLKGRQVPSWHAAIIRCIGTLGLLTCVAAYAGRRFAAADSSLPALALSSVVPICWALFAGVWGYGALLAIHPKTRGLWSRGPTAGPLVAVMLLSVVFLSFSKAMKAAAISGRIAEISQTEESLRVETAIPDRLPDHIAAMPASWRPQRLELNWNDGGMVPAGLESVALLKARGVDTVVVDGYCASTCAFIVLLFDRRLLSPKGRLGFHDVRLGFGGLRWPAHFTRQQLMAALEAAGYPRPEIVRLLTDEMQWFSRRDALAKGFATGCWDPASQAETSC